jgi:hypothetical protein
MYELMAEADSGSVGATEVRYCGGGPAFSQPSLEIVAPSPLADRLSPILGARGEQLIGSPVSDCLP